MVEVQPWRLVDSPRKLIEEAKDLQLSIKEVYFFSKFCNLILYNRLRLIMTCLTARSSALARVFETSTDHSWFLTWSSLWIRR
jgi:hypothetical protein